MEKNIIFLDETLGKEKFTLVIKPEQKEPVYLCKVCENLLAYKSFLKKIALFFKFIVFLKHSLYEKDPRKLHFVQSNVKIKKKLNEKPKILDLTMKSMTRSLLEI